MFEILVIFVLLLSNVENFICLLLSITYFHQEIFLLFGNVNCQYFVTFTMIINNKYPDQK